MDKKLLKFFASRKGNDIKEHPYLSPHDSLNKRGCQAINES
jgi:hypothetical protein